MQFKKGEALRIKPNLTARTMGASTMPARFRGVECTFVSYEGSYGEDDRATIKITSLGRRKEWYIMPHCLERIKGVCMFNKED